MSETPVILAQQRGLKLSELITYLNETYRAEGDMPVLDFDAGGGFTNASILTNFWLAKDARIGRERIEKAMVITA